MSRAEPRGVTARVPGKLNLQLRVGPRREDGYHELATVFHAVGIHDHVTVAPASRWSVTVTGRYAGQVPEDASNLALKAAKKLGRLAKVQDAVAITIDKEIPVAGGMAGGSADAAGALVACDALWDLGMGREDLARWAARLGSDVPFLLHGGTAIGTGRGERITPVLARGELSWVLWVNPGTGLSTPEVYAECDRLRRDRPVPPPVADEDLVAALRTMDTDAVARCLHNDLQEAATALKPELAEVLEAGLELGARGGLVSGSGPTVAFLVGSTAEGLDLAVGLAARGPTGEIRRTTGPASGAQVVQPIGPSGGERTG